MPLTINVPARELLNEETNRIITVKETKLVLEHSLLSVSKWEAKYKKPFLVEGALDTPDKILYYFECMTITPQNPDPNVYMCLSQEDIDRIMKYINDPMTATTYSNNKDGPGTGEFITNEIVYYWMIASNIPLECEKWHFNRLMTLIRVCSEKNQPSKKMNRRDMINQNRALNEARKKAMHTRG